MSLKLVLTIIAYQLLIQICTITIAKKKQCFSLIFCFAILHAVHLTTLLTYLISFRHLAGLDVIHRSQNVAALNHEKNQVLLINI